MFRFRFESLLKHRRHEEEVAQKELHEARQDLGRQQQLFKRTKRERRECIHRLNRCQSGAVALNEISVALLFIRKLDERLERRQGKIRQAEKRVAACRQVLTGAVKKRRMLEKLKEKEFGRYRQDLAREDLKFMDEVAATRHARSRS